MRPPSTIASPRPRRWRAAARLAGCAAAAAAALWASACSLLYDLDTAQCATDLDCSSRGGEFEFLVCRESLCQVDPQDCTTHVECYDRGANQSGPTACVDRRCVPLTTSECPVVLPLTETGDLYRQNLLADPNTLILGGFAQIDPQSLNGLALRNYDLALTQLFEAQEGLPGAGGMPRRVIMVACNSLFEGQAQLDASMVHLADTLKVPGIVPAFPAEDLQRAFQTKGLENDIFFMSALDADSSLTTLQDSGLVWFTLPGSENLSRAYRPLFERTLEFLDVTAEPVRVALVVADDVRFLADMAGTVQREIVFNQKSAFDNLAEGNLLALSVPSFTPGMTPDVTEQIQSLLDFKPHVIIAAADRLFVDDMVSLIEFGWDDDARAQPPPFYLFSPLLFGRSTDTIASLSGLRQRVVGVNAPTAEDRTLFGAYQFAFDAAYPETANPPQPNRHNFENYYDAAYYLIYAAAAANQRGLTSGQDLRVGMNDLLSGSREFGVGTRDMSEAFQQLLVGSIKLNGILGPPNWDRNGARADVGSVWCVQAGGVLATDVLRYDYDEASDTYTSRGEFPRECIEGF